MDSTLIAALGIVGLLALLMLGLPIAFALLVVGFLGLWSMTSLSTALHSLPLVTFSNLSNYVLVTVPMFVFMGNLAHHARISSEVYDVFQKLFGRAPGGLASATTAGCGLFAATSGASIACVAAMGPVAMREMEERGYSQRLAAGSISAGGTLGVLIPPSVPMLIYAISTNESVAALFLAGVVPGLLSIAIYIALIMIWATWRPQDAPPGERVSLLDKVKSLRGVWGVLVLVILVMGSMYGGLATPTEAGAIGAFGALCITLARRVPLTVIWAALFDTIKTSSIIFMIFIGTSYFGTFLTYTEFPIVLSEWLIDLGFSKTGLLILFLLLFIPLGMFLDAISILLLSLPIMWPVLNAFGIDGIWCGILVLKMLEIGQITPPVAMNVYMMKTVAPHVPLKDIFYGSFVFLSADLVTVVLLFFFPVISVGLPHYFGM